MAAFLRQIDFSRAAWLVLLAGFATIAGAWVFEYLGYAPCELCLKQRYAYYAGIPLAAAALLAERAGMRSYAIGALALAGVFFALNALFAVYHSGVELKWWPGPADCTGAFNAPASLEDFRKQLQSVQVVRCDEVALRVFGLSLANWNAPISAALALAAAFGLRNRNG